MFDAPPIFRVQRAVRRTCRRRGMKEREAEIIRRWLNREKPQDIAGALGITLGSLHCTVCRLRKRGVALPTMVQLGTARKFAPKGKAVSRA